MAIAAWLLLSFAAVAQDGVHAYDIPAQPLEQAVERFSVISGWSVMYPGDLAAGRSSHALRASLAPLPALQMLLQDSGIEAEVIGEQRVVLRRGTPAAAEPGIGAELPDAERRRRYGGLQQRLRAAFCDDPEIAPGRYAATLRFHVDGEGGAAARAAVRQWQCPPRCAPASGAAGPGAGARCRCAAAAGDPADPSFRRRPRLWPARAPSMTSRIRT
ncbi:STN domain-containing protein [Stenotrophomonas sp. CD2]|nr:STN domain-containing protein [Stenotrophomonas sp. CD2]